MRTSNIGVKGQAVNLYKLVLFESSHPFFCYYMTVFLCYNKAHATFAWKWLKLCGIPAIQRRYSDSDSVSDKGMRVKLAVWEERARRGMSWCIYGRYCGEWVLKPCQIFFYRYQNPVCSSPAAAAAFPGSDIRACIGPFTIGYLYSLLKCHQKFEYQFKLGVHHNEQSFKSN